MDAGTGGPRRYDGGRQDTGRKLHLIVDTMGWLLAVVVHAADWPDQNGVFLVPQALRLADTAVALDCRNRKGAGSARLRELLKACLFCTA